MRKLFREDKAVAASVAEPLPRTPAEQLASLELECRRLNDQHGQVVRSLNELLFHETPEVLALKRDVNAYSIALERAKAACEEARAAAQEARRRANRFNAEWSVQRRRERSSGPLQHAEDQHQQEHRARLAAQLRDLGVTVGGEA